MNKDFDENLREFCYRYRVTSVKEDIPAVYYDPQSYTPTSYYMNDYMNDFIQHRTEKMIELKMPAHALEKMVQTLAEIDDERRLLNITQIREAYEKYKVIESLYRRDY